ncbi:unnamed protein product [Prunus armeniaca]|uniref:Uncharacterized protein n=1 Tax=Prunus armeniaca TaxID=36596 RepID=A0A6J5WBF5_PRUAR|nr:unnamed protein product [Prunus armeniaca]
MVYHPSAFLAHEDCILLDTKTLADDTFEYLICMALHYFLQGWVATFGWNLTTQTDLLASLVLTKEF